MKRSSYRDRDYSFGQAMLTLRTNIGLTQTGLADYLNVSRRAVGDWEAGSSYPKVEHIKKLIVLGIKQRAFPAGNEAVAIRELWQISRQKVLLDESWLAGLVVGGASAVATITQPVEIRVEKPPLNREIKPVINLPFQPTPFVGRGDEIKEIARLLSDPNCRLLTLLGPGGMGKTRLAIEVAQGQIDKFNDGIVFVPLASIGMPSQIVSAIGSALNLSFAGQANPTAHLLQFLQTQQMLLILDNFEHVLEGSDLVYDILQHARNVTLLVTSRVRLNLQAEWLFDVEGLPYPLNDSQDLTDLTQYAAVKLFIQRAIQVQVTFQASQSTLQTIVGICQQVAGMPLAIELAAAGVRTLSVAEIEEQIRSNFDSLTTSLRDVPARHRSLRAVFDHSWNLLSEAERTLLSRLAIFRGSCAADAAEKVTEATILQLLKLVDKSLLRQISAPNTSEPRFFLLEPIREYALEKLKLSGELQIRQHTHATYYLHLAERAIEQWQTQGLDIALEDIDHELDNIRAALQWSLENNVLFGLQLAGTLARYWRSRTHLTEGRMWLENLLSLDAENPNTEEMRARLLALNGAGWLAIDEHDFEQATLRFEEGNLLRSMLGETEDDTTRLANAGMQARANGQYDRATMLLEDMLARLRALGDRGTLSSGGFGFSLYALALVLREQSKFELATQLLEECVEFHREMNDREAVMQAILGLSDIARDQGDAANVRKYAQQCLESFREIGTQWAIGFSLNNLGMAAYLEGNLVEAYTLVNESLVIFRNHNSHGSIAEVLVTLGHILLAQGDLIGANEAFSESLQLALSVGPKLLVVANLEGLACVLIRRDQTDFAIRFFSAASALRHQMGTPIRPIDQPIIAQSKLVAERRLDHDSYTTLWANAERMTLEQILSELPVGKLLMQSEKLSISAESPEALQSVNDLTEQINFSDPLASPADRRRVDWGDALTVPTFYGREWELNLLKEWVIEERCQVVSVLGIGGMGKSVLTVSLMHQVAEHFEVIIWRSLRDLPTPETFLGDLLQVLAPEKFPDAALSFERKLNILKDQMRIARTLIVLDNLESVLEEGEVQGRMRPGYEGFAQFLRVSAETKHQSCIILTSREKPAVLIALEGSRSTVRTLRLARLNNEACEQLLAEKDVIGSSQEHERLIEAYTGNPLALKIVAQTIVDLFDGSIALFLEQGEIIFGGVRELLSEQFVRLSALEQSVLLWLAIMREPLTFDELIKILVIPVPRGRVLEAVESLRRRSLIERGLQSGSFTLQSVVLEYVTSRFVTEIGNEILTNQFSRLIEYGLELAQAREYVRQTQQRLITSPILQYLHIAYPHKNAVEGFLLAQLSEFSTWPDDSQGYAPSNLLALLHLQRGNLSGVNLSRLTLRGVNLQGVAMRDTSLAGSLIIDSIFTETFDALTAVAISPNGTYWAAASRRGEVWLWTGNGDILYRSWQAHGETIPTLTFSSDERTLVTGSWDGTFKLWNVDSGALLWTGGHASLVKCVVFSPDGGILASAGNDGIVQLWDVKTGARLTALSHTTPVPALVWSLDGSIIVTGDRDGIIRIWDLQSGQKPSIRQTLLGHTNWVDAIALSPDGMTLCSVGWDGTVRLWEFATGRLINAYKVHTDWVQCAIWTRDGRTLATCSRDHTVCLWHTEQGGYQTILLRHAANVVRLAFTPDGQRLISASEDGMLRVWDVSGGRCIRIIQGYANSVNALAWSFDGSHLVCGGTDTFVTIYPIASNEPPRVLHGHIGSVFGVGWSADGRWLASSGWSNTIQIWDTTLQTEGHLLRHPDDEGNIFYSLVWSPSGAQLACGTNRRGVYVFDLQNPEYHWSGDQTPVWIRQVDWHPQGTKICGGGEDGIVYIWDAESGMLVQTLTGHHNMITSIAWSPDGTLLASGSKGGKGGELFLWNLQQGKQVLYVDTHPGMVYSLAWNQSSDLVISGSSDGMLRWWDVQTGQCVRTIQAHQGAVHALKRSPDGRTLASCGGDGAIILWDLQSGKYLQTLRRDRPYERLNITGIRGLTDAQKMTLQTLGAIESD